jgi:hypothetical protein
MLASRLSATKRDVNLRQMLQNRVLRTLDKAPQPRIITWFQAVLQTFYFELFTLSFLL